MIPIWKILILVCSVFATSQANAKGSNLFLILIFNVVCSLGLTESRQEIMRLQDRNNSTRKMEEGNEWHFKQKEMAQIFSSSEKPGFYQNDGQTLKDNSVVDSLTEALSKDREVDNVLILKFSCSTEESFISYSPRYKNLDWEISGISPKEKIKGTISIDHNGIGRIRFSSLGKVGSRKIKIKVGAWTINIILDSGPYTFDLNEKDCRAFSAAWNLELSPPKSGRSFPSPLIAKTKIPTTHHRLGSAWPLNETDRNFKFAVPSFSEPSS